VQVAALLALALAGIACRLRARADRDADLRACARLLDALLAADLLGLLLAQLLAGATTPYAGWRRAAFHASQAAFLAWPAGVAWLAWERLADAPSAARARWLLASCYPATLALLARSYPGLRGERLADAYRAVQVVCAVVGACALLADRPRGFRVGRAQLVALALLAGLGAELSGPYLTAPFTSWWTAQVTWTLTLTAVAVAAAWRRPWTRSPAS